MNNNVLCDVVRRMNGELYIGVVGSVRSGKSMFIRKFMQNKVLPYLSNDMEKQKIIDELPQSAEGKSIMTVEPKFVPSTSANVVIDGELNLSIRLVDCVGYVIPSSKGYVNDDGSPRLVRTPWFNEDIPFIEAAAIGTKKVIENHSHIGIVITSDGSFGEFSRDEYCDVEKQLVNEMNSLNKPYVIVLNTTMPNSTETNELIKKMNEEYGVCVLACDVNNLSDNDMDNILKSALSEFPITKLSINVPNWLNLLSDENPTKQVFNDCINDVTLQYHKFKDVDAIRENLSKCELFNDVIISSLDSGTGEVTIDIDLIDNLYDKIIAEIVGEEILNDKANFLDFIQESSKAKCEYENIKPAIEAVKTTGYGISIPKINEMEFDTPEVIKQGNRYGIKLRAIAPSIHMIKVDVESTFEPIIGSYEQSKQIIDKLTQDFENNPEDIWNVELFGRKLSEVVNDGIKSKIYLLPDDVEYKFKEALEKIINKGKGGVIAFIL